MLPNGNLLITSSEGGRVFEVTPDRRVVWQWVPPYLPMRVIRYPEDRCPQLAALGPMDSQPVSRTDRPLWVDIELGQFAFRKDYRVATKYGLVREILHRPIGCRDLLLPVDPVIQVAYGFDDSALDGAPASASFRVSVRDLASDETRVVIEDTLPSTGEEIFRDRYVAVPGFGLRRAELCIEAWIEGEDEDGDLHRSVFMSNPRFYSRVRAQLTRKWKERRMSLQEQTLEQRQLHAIGYVQ